jgi:hypothetical protein
MCPAPCRSKGAPQMPPQASHTKHELENSAYSLTERSCLLPPSQCEQQIFCRLASRLYRPRRRPRGACGGHCSAALSQRSGLSVAVAPLPGVQRPASPSSHGWVDSFSGVAAGGRAVRMPEVPNRPPLQVVSRRGLRGAAARRVWALGRAGRCCRAVGELNSRAVLGAGPSLATPRARRAA